MFYWDKVTYEWPNQTFASRYGNVRSIPVGIKAHGDKVYMNMPRWFGNAHPVNLAVADRPTEEELAKGPIKDQVLKYKFIFVGEAYGFGSY